MPAYQSPLYRHSEGRNRPGDTRGPKMQQGVFELWCVLAPARMAADRCGSKQSREALVAHAPFISVIFSVPQGPASYY